MRNEKHFGIEQNLYFASKIIRITRKKLIKLVLSDIFYEADFFKGFLNPKKQLQTFAWV